MLSFDTPSTRRKQEGASAAPSSTATPSSESHQRAPDAKQVAALALQHLHESSSESKLGSKRPSLEQNKASSDPKSLSLSASTSKERRPSSSKAAAFDAAAILQRRRDEAVFGLKEPVSPSLDKHDTAGAKKAEVAEGYQM